MKRIFAAAGIILLLAGAVNVRADGPDDAYVSIYNLIQEADTLAEGGQLQPAMAKYTQAQQALQKFKTTFPGWNEKVVSYRLDYVATKMVPIAAKLPPDKSVPATTGTSTNRNTPGFTSDIDSQIKSLTDEIARLESNNNLLNAKLKEALSVQPAGVDPKEMAKAGDRIKLLEKENDLMKVSLDQERIRSAKLSEGPAATAAINQALAEVKAKLAQQSESMGALQSENEILKKQAAELRQKSDATSVESARLLEQAGTKMAGLLANYETLRTEKTQLESRLNEALVQSAKSKRLEDELAVTKLTGRAQEAELVKLRVENGRFAKDLAELEKKLAGAETAAGAGRGDEAKRRQLELELAAAIARAKDVEHSLTGAAGAARENEVLAKKLQKDKDDLEKERAALRARVAQVDAAAELTDKESRKLKQQQKEMERQLAAAKTAAEDKAAQAVKLQKDKEALEVQRQRLETSRSGTARLDFRKHEQLEQDLVAAAAKTREVEKKLSLAVVAARDKEVLATKLLSENEQLQKAKEALQLRVARALIATDSSDPQKLQQQQKETNQQLAAAKAAAAEKAVQARKLEQDKAALEKQRVELESKLAKSSSEAAAAAKSDQKKREQLDRELADLRKKLERAAKERSSKGARGLSPAETQRAETMLARLEILEAKPVPYSAEEMALFSRSGVALSSATLSTTPEAGPDGSTVPRLPVKKTYHPVPDSARLLVVEAERAVQAGNFAKAGEKYLDVLRQDENNVNTLANLASIEVEMNRVDEAEKHIKKALVLDPEDDFSLYVLGRVRFSQEKFDDALDALSRSAKINPENADTQNYLGIALSEKGLRLPAETALRKAIQLRPGHADAHNNLAVVYITQKPPAVALARWHYQKSLAAGHPKNPALEKLMDAAK